MFSHPRASQRVWAVAWIVSPLMLATAGADQQEMVRLVETHATNKQAVLSQLQQMSRLRCASLDMTHDEVPIRTACLYATSEGDYVDNESI